MLALVTAAAVLFAPASGQPAPALSAQTQHPCVPFGGLLVPKTIRRRDGDVNEVTERLGNHWYRVTRCGLDGHVISEMTVEPVDDPDGRLVLAPAMILDRKKVRTLDYGEARDPLWAKEWRRVRDRVARRVRPATPGKATTDPAFDPKRATGTAFAAAKSACDDGEYVTLGPYWPDGYRWKWNDDSFGINYDTRDALKAGANAWDKTNTDCNLDDISATKPDYDGATSKHAGVLDGVNTVEKGDIAEVGCEGALACALGWRTGLQFIESDIMFNKKFKWTNKGSDGAYDYRAVATHESGHVIGLADLNNSPNLTMYYQVKTESTKARTLGRGDVKGLRDVYP